jgi:hypothetical protein
MPVRSVCCKIRDLAVFALVIGLIAPAHARGIVEEVYVAKTSTTDDRAVIVRRSGEVYRVEKGNGCFSLWRYQGSVVVIMSPQHFLGLGSKLVIPETNQNCSIWSVARGKPWEIEDGSLLQFIPD